MAWPAGSCHVLIILIWHFLPTPKTKRNETSLKNCQRAKRNPRETNESWQKQHVALISKGEGWVNRGGRVGGKLHCCFVSWQLQQPPLPLLLSSLLHISCCGDECEFLLKNGKYKIKTCQQGKEIKNERGKRERGKKADKNFNNFTILQYSRGSAQREF